MADLAPPWWDLWQRSPTATPFQTPAWLISWWRTFAPGKLNAVAAWHGDTLVGLAPFYLDGTRLLPLGISVSDYLDVLIDPEHARAAGEALVHHVGRSGAWRTWEICDLPPQSCAVQLPRPVDCHDACQHQNLCLVLPLPDWPDRVLEMISVKQRRSLTYTRKRAARHGAVTLERLDGDDPEQSFRLLATLHEASWRSRGQPGVLADPRVKQLHESSIPSLAVRGLVRFYVARLGGRIASIYYGFQHRERAYFYLSGFDPEFAADSPGKLLLAHVIEDSVRQGAREFDFLRGDEPYKRAWPCIERWTSRRILERTRAEAASCTR